MITPCVISLLVLCGFAIGKDREYIFVSTSMSWWDAQSYCRQQYTDLATIISVEENDMIQTAARPGFPNSWIGLFRDRNNLKFWKWSDKQQSSFRRWRNGLPIDYSQHCVRRDSDGLWTADNCDEPRSFFCERILILVNENKTWEEAYEGCKTNYTGLAFLDSSVQLYLAKRESTAAQTDSVWTGLRFLAGEWFWVNGEPLGSLVSLPSCPAQPYRCGARNSKKDVWENRDCDEKLNFLCN